MSRIEKIVPVPMTMWVAFCEQGHAAATSTFQGVIGQVGDEVECNRCREPRDFREALGAIPLEPGVPDATEAIRKGRE